MERKNKRPRSPDTDEEFDVSNIHICKSAKVHGIMTALSPVKASTTGKSKFFHGELTDGKAKVRFVGFDSKSHEKLADFYKTKQPLTLSGCSINESKYSSDLEVIVKQSTQLLHSSSKFEVPDSMFEIGDNQLVNIEEISQIPNYQKVSVRIKVIAENNPVQGKKGLTKQEYIIGDSTGCCKITTWEDNIGLLVKDCSYKLSNLLVRTFNEKKYLSIPKDGFEIIPIDDIGMVEDDTAEIVEEKILKSVSIVGVKSLETYDACYSCSGRVTAKDGDLGCCNRCGSTQLLGHCKEQALARIHVQASNDRHTIHTLSVFSPILDEICGEDGVTLKNLLSSDTFNLVYSDKNIIVSISR